MILILIIVVIWWHGRTPEQTEEAKNILEQIDANNKILIDYVIKRYPDNDLGKRLRKKYRTSGLRENFPVDPSNTSYTTDKGRILALCLQSGGKYYDMDVIRFVDIHELAHIGTLGWGHENDFWNNFKFLLQAARDAQIYNPTNFATSPFNYCGLDVNYNPLYDNSLTGETT